MPLMKSTHKKYTSKDWLEVAIITRTSKLNIFMWVGFD